jgi:hypothetical protein
VVTAPTLKVPRHEAHPHHRQRTGTRRLLTPLLAAVEHERNRRDWSVPARRALGEEGFEHAAGYRSDSQALRS